MDKMLLKSKKKNQVLFHNMKAIIGVKNQMLVKILKFSKCYRCKISVMIALRMWT
jgi:hypothetical protein